MRKNIIKNELINKHKFIQTSHYRKLENNDEVQKKHLGLHNLFKLDNSLLSLISLIKQRYFLHSKKESIAAAKQAKTIYKIIANLINKFAIL